MTDLDDLVPVAIEAAAPAAETAAEPAAEPATERPAPGELTEAGLEALLLQRDRELLRAPRHVGVRVAVEALVGEPGDDLLVAEERLRAPQERRKRQLEVHHLALHLSTSSVQSSRCAATFARWTRE